MSVSKKDLSDFVKGEEIAINKVLEEYKRLMFFIISTYVKNKDDIEDILQESVIKVIKNKQKVKEVSDLKSYIGQICKTTSIDYLRNKDNTLLIDSIDDYYGNEDKTNEFLNSLGEYLTNKETIVLQYKIMFGYKWKEISKCIGVPIPTLRAIYKNAISKLRRVYKNEH